MVKVKQRQNRTQHISRVNQTQNGIRFIVALKQKQNMPQIITEVEQTQTGPVLIT